MFVVNNLKKKRKKKGKTNKNIVIILQLKIIFQILYNLKKYSNLS